MTEILRPRILVVDDASENLVLMSDLLKDEYRVRLASSGEKAIQLLTQGELPDLILLDVVMPGMDGYAVCAQLKVNPAWQAIPVIFLTANNSAAEEECGLALGAVDYITKPFSAPVVLARVRNHLLLKSAADFLRDQNDFLASEVRRQTAELAAIQQVTIQVMASLAETRDSDTGQHIRRTQLYVRALAEQLRHHPRFAAELTTTQIETLYQSAPLHDIGKVGIPDRILLKPGKLDAAEFEIMKTHAQQGAAAIETAEANLGLSVPFLATAKAIARSHHEKWDGSGYPDCLSGDDIPLAARLMAIADVYDALISRRIYKAGMPHADAVAEIYHGRGSHFDPDIVDAFMLLEAQFAHIAAEHADAEADWQRKLNYLDQSLAEKP
ncbi:HD-GYP domain-containing protein [Chitinibacter tainanensis]|uniref:HD-GYP domain-containing protein n=1 Tax=Chitinibacter tainanensis TaxID=230667 RepID=UPI0004096C6E|nr:two-component system response regulator [Chitinibacter tainanensis]